MPLDDMRIPKIQRSGGKVRRKHNKRKMNKQKKVQENALGVFLVASTLCLLTKLLAAKNSTIHFLSRCFKFQTIL